MPPGVVVIDEVRAIDGITVCRAAYLNPFYAIW
jgi:hypothetical protein